MENEEKEEKKIKKEREEKEKEKKKSKEEEDSARRSFCASSRRNASRLFGMQRTRAWKSLCLSKSARERSFRKMQLPWQRNTRRMLQCS